MTEHCRAIFAVPVDMDYGLAAIAAAVHADDLPLVSEAIAKAHDMGTMFEIQFRFSIGGGRMHWVRCRGRTESDHQRHMVRMSGTIVDISERITMQAEIERQRQSLMHLNRVGAVGELSGALAHELNQPLTAILSNAQAIQRMIKREPINMEELRNAIADIIEDDSRAGDVIRHLRTLLKKEEMRLEPVDMEALVRKVMSLVRNEMVTRHVIPVIKLVEGAPPILGDAVQLQQLLLNLILNAIEAIANTGQKNGILILTGQITGELRESRYYLTISDTGSGISGEITEKLFEPFFSTKKQGLGLGLSISHAIVQGHGGSIHAENNSWGGATFHIQLPLIKTGAA
jgi:C4-dicarboxylate-specific signal transduction histidine kinase